jgi:hypothetical protein
VLKQLIGDIATCIRIEQAIKQIMGLYSVAKPLLDKVMSARARLLYNFAKLALKVGVVLDQSETKAKAMQKSFTPTQQKAIVDETMRGQFGDIEGKYRSAFVDAGICTEAALPSQHHPREQKQGPSGTTASKSQSGVTPAAIVHSHAASVDSVGQEMCLSKENVLHRLQIDALPECIQLRSLDFLLGEAQAEGGAEAADLAKDHIKAYAAQGRDGGHYKAQLQELESDSQQPSGWSGTILYANEKFTIDSDLLAPRTKEELPEAKDVIRVLENFDWDVFPDKVLQRIAAHALDQAFAMSFDAVRGVAVEQYGKDERAVKDGTDLPAKFRVKALQDFKIGELVLTPYSLFEDAAVPLLTRSSDVAASQKFQEPDTSQMEPNSLPRVFIKVLAKEKKSRIAIQEPDTSQRSQQTRETFYVNSPLFGARLGIKRHKLATNNMSPLWALTRTSSTKDVNMELVVKCFDVAPMQEVGGKMPSAFKKPMWAALVQAAANTRKIKKGDILHLSLMRDDVSSSDADDSDN